MKTQWRGVTVDTETAKALTEAAKLPEKVRK